MLPSNEPFVSSRSSPQRSSAHGLLAAVNGLLQFAKHSTANKSFAFSCLDIHVQSCVDLSEVTVEGVDINAAIGCVDVPMSAAEADTSVTAAETSSCCICRNGVDVVFAQCGCAFHVNCFVDLVQAKGMQPLEVRCAVHNLPLSGTFSGGRLKDSNANANECNDPPSGSPQSCASTVAEVADLCEVAASNTGDLPDRHDDQVRMFTCGICLCEHEVEAACALPCDHQFCLQCLGLHFEILVRERRLDKLVCPAVGCDCSLRSQWSIHILQQFLTDDVFYKLLEFLARDDPHVIDCKCAGCEERIFLDEGETCSDIACPRGHRFCGNCDLGPHPGLTCEHRKQQENYRLRIAGSQDQTEDIWQRALEMGWKPCPRKCSYGGGFKNSDECDHVTCKCGFEFCWDCGVDRRVVILHDNRWHKPSCRYHTPWSQVNDPPRHERGCPECQKLGRGIPCAFPTDDGYPYLQSSERQRDHTCKEWAAKSNLLDGSLRPVAWA